MNHRICYTDWAHRCPHTVAPLQMGSARAALAWSRSLPNNGAAPTTCTDMPQPESMDASRVWFATTACSRALSPATTEGSAVDTSFTFSKASKSLPSCPGCLHPQFRDQHRRDIGKSQPMWSRFISRRGSRLRGASTARARRSRPRLAAGCCRSTCTTRCIATPPSAGCWQPLRAHHENNLFARHGHAGGTVRCILRGELRYAVYPTVLRTRICRLGSPVAHEGEQGAVRHQARVALPVRRCVRRRRRASHVPGPAPKHGVAPSQTARMEFSATGPAPKHGVAPSQTARMEFSATAIQKDGRRILVTWQHRCVPRPRRRHALRERVRLERERELPVLGVAQHGGERDAVEHLALRRGLAAAVASSQNFLTRTDVYVGKCQPKRPPKRTPRPPHQPRELDDGGVHVDQLGEHGCAGAGGCRQPRRPDDERHPVQNGYLLRRGGAKTAGIRW
jgi:hypothetical protein